MARRPVKEIFKDRFKAARTKAELSQDDVAKRLGVSKTSISEWENGHTEPSFTRIAELADLFGIEPEDFFRAPEAVRVEGAIAVEDSLAVALESFKRTVQKAATDAAKKLSTSAERAVRDAQARSKATDSSP